MTPADLSSEDPLRVAAAVRSDLEAQLRALLGADERGLLPLKPLKGKKVRKA